MTCSASSKGKVPALQLGTLGCILPGQVLSPSPTRKIAVGARIRGRQSPGCDRPSGNRSSSGSDRSGGAVSSSAGAAAATLLGTISSLSTGDTIAVLQQPCYKQPSPATVLQDAIAVLQGAVAEEAKAAVAEEERAPPCRGRRKRHEGSGPKRSTICTDQGIPHPVEHGYGDCLPPRANAPSPSGSPHLWERQGASSVDDVERLIARCMTHERPKALVQANVTLLDSCIMKLGEKVPTGENRSDRIRLMLRLTDELRRYNADLTEQGVPTKDDKTLTAW